MVRLLPILALSLLAACGWQLKGANPGIAELGTVHLSGDQPNGAVNRAVRNELRISGVKMVSTPMAAQHRLWIGAEESRLRTASYDALVRAAENTLLMRTDYQLLDTNGKVIAGPTTVYAERVYEYDVQGVTSSAAQLSVVTQELQDRLAQQIVRQVMAVVKKTAPVKGANGADSAQ
jgi:LPS-assembly lipoprotein